MLWLLTLLALLAAPVGAASEPCDGYRFQSADAQSADAQSADAQSADAQSADAIPPPAVDSFLLRVEAPERPDSFILGTFHSADAGVLDRWSRVALVLAEPGLRRFVTERDLTDPGEATLRELPPGRKLADHLTDAPGLYPRVIDTLRRYNLPIAAAEHWRPWFLAALLNQAPALPAPGERILDVWLLDQAQALGLEIRFLETFDAIAAGYGRFDPDEQLRLLWEAVCNQEVLSALVSEQTEAYAANDVTGLHAALHRYTGSDPMLADRLGEVFVVERNAAFWRELEPELRRGGLFVALGALHVFGAGGLLERLAAADMAVESVDPNALGGSIPDALRTRLIGWIVDWPGERGRGPITTADFADLHIDPESLPTLRRRLCPGRRCMVEATYLPDEQRIMVETGRYARLLAASRRPQAESLLLRELVRHALYRHRGEELRQRLTDHPRAEACLRSAVLHQAWLAQSEWLNQQGAAPSGHPLVRDARCPPLF